MNSLNLELLKQLGQLRTAITAQSSVDVAITASANTQYDCVSRYFAPAMGIAEDPVTGSIHTAIAPLWAEKLPANRTCGISGFRPRWRISIARFCLMIASKFQVMHSYICRVKS